MRNIKKYDEFLNENINPEIQTIDESELEEILSEGNTPILIIRDIGHGHTNAIKEAAKGLGFDFKHLNLPIMDITDLIGLPHGDNYYPPSILPNKDVDGAGIILFDEIDKANKVVRDGCLKLAIDKELNNYTLPDNWRCVFTASNADFLIPRIEQRFDIFKLI